MILSSSNRTFNHLLQIIHFGLASKESDASVAFASRVAAFFFFFALWQENDASITLIVISLSYESWHSSAMNCSFGGDQVMFYRQTRWHSYEAAGNMALSFCS